MGRGPATWQVSRPPPPRPAPAVRQCTAPVLCQRISKKYRESGAQSRGFYSRCERRGMDRPRHHHNSGTAAGRRNGIFLLPCGDLSPRGNWSGVSLWHRVKIHTLVSKAWLLPTPLRPQWSSAQTPFTQGSVSRSPPAPGWLPLQGQFSTTVSRGGHLLT